MIATVFVWACVICVTVLFVIYVFTIFDSEPICATGWEHRLQHDNEIVRLLRAQAERFNLRTGAYEDKLSLLRGIEGAIRELKWRSKHVRREGRCSVIVDSALREMQWAASVLNLNRKDGWTNYGHEHLPEDVRLIGGMFIRVPVVPHYCPVERLSMKGEVRSN